MPAGHGRTLKSKLLAITLSTLVVMSVVTLATVAWTHFTIEAQRRSDIERHIRDSVSSKAVTLTNSHALALKGLVADNAFGDVRKLVANAVRDDSDVVYGLFVSADGKPWTYVSPTAPPGRDEADEPVAQHALNQVKLDPSKLAQETTQRRLVAFGQELQECAAPVVSDDGEWLGTVIYGFSDKRTHAAVAEAGQQSERALQRALLTIAVAALISFLLGIAWVVRASARITRPVAELTAAANEIAAGKRGVRVSITSRDEVEVLAGAFNQMLQANEDAMRQLELTTERALEADRLKSEFLANMSHEIRTPMNGVLGMLKLIQGMPLDAKLRRYVDTIDSSANALLTIINDILDFSKMEAGKYSIQEVVFDARTVVQEVAELLASRAHDKKLELVYRITQDLPDSMIGDPDRFRQILNNLVGNAVKFTDRGEVFIDVSVASSAENHVVVRVAVHDTGIGIDSQQLPKLYEAFSQLDGSMARQHGGTGLGLAISKRLVNMMGGDIEVDSTPGRGSTFAFTVRFGVVRGAVRSVVPKVGGRVLVVEPHQRSRDVIEEHLRAWGMDCTALAAGKDTLPCLERALADTHPFDAVVLSAELQDVAAVDLIDQIRRQPELRRVPLVLLTAPADDLFGGRHPEFVVQLQKPLRFSELYNCLNGTLSGQMVSAPADRAHSSGKVATHLPVLVVDDNDINRFVVVEELGQRGFQTDEAVNGREAFEKFQRKQYLCVLMDCQMPTVDGYEATRLIRRYEAARHSARTPIIALTAHALVGERERVLQSGMDDFLSKPFRPSSLEKVLKLHIKSDMLPLEAPSPWVPDLDPNAKRSEKLIRLFLDRLPGQLADLDSAIRRERSGDVRACAHKLKGSCLAVGADRMTETAEAVRKHGAEARFGEAALALDELKRRFERVGAQLRAELPAPAETVSA